MIDIIYPMNGFLNDQSFLTLLICTFGTFAVVIFPILLSKFVMCFSEGFKNKDQKKITNSFYYLLASFFAFFSILKMLFL